MDLHGITADNVCLGYTRTACLDDLAGNISSGTGVKPEEVFANCTRLIPAGCIGTPEEFCLCRGLSRVWMCRLRHRHCHRCRWRRRPEPLLAQ
jgi:hypothetical protein